MPSLYAAVAPRATLWRHCILGTNNAMNDQKFHKFTQCFIHFIVFNLYHVICSLFAFYFSHMIIDKL